MKRILALTVLFLSVGFTALAGANGGPHGDEWNAQELMERMADDGKLLVVFYHGSDWCVYGEQVREDLWNSPSFVRNTARDFYRLHSDWLDYEPADPAAYAEHLAQTSPVRKCPHVLPSISVFDAAGRVCGNLAQLEKRTEAEVLNWLGRIREAVAERDKAFQEAQRLEGREKAGRLAEGLAALAEFYGPVGQNKNYIWEWMCQWQQYKELCLLDSEDATGYQKHMEFKRFFADYRSRCEKAANEAEALALSRELGGSVYLTSAQKQMAEFLPYYYYKKEDRREKMADAVRKALRIKVAGTDRDQWFQNGLTGLLCMLDEGSVSVPYGWRDQHCTTEFTWEIETGVRRFFRLPAAYTITFSPGVGNRVRGLQRKPGGADELAIQEVQLLVNKECVWKTQLDKPATCSQRTGEVVVTVELRRELAATDKVILLVKGTATGPDSRGEIAITPFLELE